MLLLFLLQFFLWCVDFTSSSCANFLWLGDATFFYLLNAGTMFQIWQLGHPSSSHWESIPRKSFSSHFLSHWGHYFVLTRDLIANLLIGNSWSICFAPLDLFFQSQQFSNVWNAKLWSSRCIHIFAGCSWTAIWWWQTLWTTLMSLSRQVLPVSLSMWK